MYVFCYLHENVLFTYKMEYKMGLKALLTDLLTIVVSPLVDDWLTIVLFYCTVGVHLKPT